MQRIRYQDIPASHGKHELDPVVLANVPGLQSSHFVLFVTLQHKELHCILL
jgi:hypothetical protein